MDDAMPIKKVHKSRDPDNMPYVPCTAKSKQSGMRCKRRPIKGGYVCTMHGGGSPLVRASAMERLRSMQPAALNAIDDLMVQTDAPAVRLGAAKAVIDWTEGAAVQKVEVQTPATVNFFISIAPDSDVLP